MAIANITPEPTISIQFDNGSPPQKVGNTGTKFGESFNLSPGESFIIGGGSSWFSFHNFPTTIEQVKFTLEVHPGDSFLNLSLPGGFDLTTKQPQQKVVFVREGEAMSIAYGFDSTQRTFAHTKFTFEGVIEKDTTEKREQTPQPS